MLAPTPSHTSRTLIAFMFGFSTACAAFTGARIVQQIYRTWSKSRNIFAHPYIVMIAAEWLSSVVISIITFLFIDGVIPPGFGIFFSILCLWVVQIQCIMHIIINRIALIMYDQKRVRRLKWAATLLIGAINVSVFIIWMPARLQISPGWENLNDVWDRIEKGIFAILDLLLNLYFIYLVRKELITCGLTKFQHLYRFNIGMIFISISLDVVLIGIMSIPNQSTFLYVQFHPLMYLIKLHIEMNMAELILKIVNAQSSVPGDELYCYADANSSNRLPKSSRARNESGTSRRSAEISSGPPRPQTPADVDVTDVANRKNPSMAEEGDAGLVVPICMRPGFYDDISEVTGLEVALGCSNAESRER